MAAATGESEKPTNIGRMSVSSARIIGTEMSITGAVFMPNGKLILCGIRDVLFIYQSDFNMHCELKLPSSPWDIARVDGTSVVVSLPDEKRLQFVTIEPAGSLGKFIQLKRCCWGLDVNDGAIYVCTHGKNSIAKVRILNIEGEVIKTLGSDLLNRSIFVEPFFVRVGKREDGVTPIIVSDYKTNTVTCITETNDVISQKRLTHARGPSGLLLDEENNALVCGALTNNIIMVATGKRVNKETVWLQVDHGLSRPYCMGYRREDNVLVVGMLYSPHCMMYRLTESSKRENAM